MSSFSDSPDQLNSFREEIEARCQNQCELCSSDSDLGVSFVAPTNDLSANTCILVCGICREQLENHSDLDDAHWHCLQTSAWTHVPSVQVIAWRLLNQLKHQPWAQELLDQIYLDEATLEWAEKGVDVPSDDDDEPTFDGNGTRLLEGDTVQIIKDLDVKGTGFVAKRGTIVKGIHLTSNPEHVEGRVNKTAIVLKTCFLKKTNL